MSSTLSTLKPEASHNNAAGSSIWMDPNDRPYIEVVSSLGETKQSLVQPETTLALEPGKGLPGLPHHFRNFYVYPDIPRHAKTASRNPYSHGTVAHRNSSKVTWHPRGLHGPEEPITELPFFVDTDPFGETTTYYGEKPVPLPPTEGYTAERPAGHYLPSLRIVGKRLRKTYIQDDKSLAPEEEKKGDTDVWGRKRGWYYGDLQSRAIVETKGFCVYVVGGCGGSSVYRSSPLLPENIDSGCMTKTQTSLDPASRSRPTSCPCTVCLEARSGRATGSEAREHSVSSSSGVRVAKGLPIPC